MFQREIDAYKSRIRRISRTIGHADLTDADNGDAQAISVGQLPAGAVVLGCSRTLTTNFAGGSISTLVAEIGYTADPDAIQAQATVLSGAAAAPVKGTAGVLVGPLAAAVDVVVTFTPDAGHNLAALDAGAATFDVWFCIPDVKNLPQGA